MGKAETIVLEGYPVEQLPADFNVSMEAGTRVRITIEREPTRPWGSLLERIALYHRHHPGQSVTTEEAVARIRMLRDEWD